MSLFATVDKTKRTCSTCEVTKSVDEFYRDGSDKNGEPRYRRDCKECYRVTRLKSRRKKSQKLIPKTTRRRR